MPSGSRIRWIWLGASLLAASVGAGSCLLILLETLMRSDTGDLFVWVTIALFIIVVAFAGVVVLAFTVKPASFRWFASAAIVVMLVAGFAPRLLYANARHQAELARVAEGRAFEAKILTDLKTRAQDIDARIAAQRPYNGPESLTLFNMVINSDLSYRSLGDHSAEGLALLKRALDGKVLDPNVMVRGPAVVDKEDEPLFMQVFRAHIRWIGHGEKLPPMVRRVDWEAFKLLVANGADLTRPNATRVAEDIGKTEVPVSDSRYVRLQ